jgi:hypothetical protein
MVDLTVFKKDFPGFATFVNEDYSGNSFIHGILGSHARSWIVQGACPISWSPFLSEITMLQGGTGSKISLLRIAIYGL